MIIELQSDMDYENLSNFLIKSGRADILFNLFDTHMLMKNTMKQAVFAAFQESLR